MPVFHNPRYVRVDTRNSGDPVGAVTRAVEPFAYALFMLLFAGAIWWLFKEIAFAVGALAIGFVAGRVLVKLLFRKVRRSVSTALEPIRPYVPVGRAAPQAPAVSQAPQAQLPQAGGQHLHLHLDGMSAEDVARLLGGR